MYNLKNNCMEIILSIVLIIFGILQIILFFKIWKMTDDVSQIKDLLERSNNTKKHQKKVNHQKNTERPKSQSDTIFISDEGFTPHEGTTSSKGITLYGWVTEIESRKEFQVMEIYENGSLLCVNAENPDGKIFERFEVE